VRGRVLSSFRQNATTQNLRLTGIDTEPACCLNSMAAQQGRTGLDHLADFVTVSP
jgi:hypothetical protein